MKKFAHIKKLFKLYNEPDCYPGGYKQVRIWNIVKGLMLWLNDRDVDGTFIQIKTYTELNKKIQDSLKSMGYSDVSEIPEDIQITCD
jgi:hypothetical protein